MTAGWRGIAIISVFRLSIAACVWSGFEPLAAVICLSGYAILYLLAVWVFAAPWVTYLAAAALTGAAYFGSTPGARHHPGRSGLAGGRARLWHSGPIRVGLRRRQAAEAYRVPWLQAAPRTPGRGDVRRDVAPAWSREWAPGPEQRRSW